MPNYRTVEPVSFVKDGQVVSVKADRVVELDEVEAQELAGKVLLVENRTPTMFPHGSPHIPVHIVRPTHAQPVAGEPVAPAAPKVAAKKAVTPQPAKQEAK